MKTRVTSLYFISRGDYLMPVHLAIQMSFHLRVWLHGWYAGPGSERRPLEMEVPISALIEKATWACAVRLFSKKQPLPEDVWMLLSWRNVRSQGNFCPWKYLRLLSPSSSDLPISTMISQSFCSFNAASIISHAHWAKMLRRKSDNSKACKQYSTLDQPLFSEPRCRVSYQCAALYRARLNSH